jgi:citronellol/citronellal dehydrogenase
MDRLASLNKQINPNLTGLPNSSDYTWVMKMATTFDFKKAGSLKGKTLVISGASRGIGLAIGKAAARDGANVAILAKTAEPHPKLPGFYFYT